MDGYTIILCWRDQPLSRVQTDEKKHGGRKEENYKNWVFYLYLSSLWGEKKKSLSVSSRLSTLRASTLLCVTFELWIASLSCLILLFILCHYTARTHTLTNLSLIFSHADHSYTLNCALMHNNRCSKRAQTHKCLRQLGSFSQCPSFSWAPMGGGGGGTGAG